VGGLIKRALLGKFTEKGAIGGSVQNVLGDGREGGSIYEKK
jgi:hypothetical protein